MDNNASLNEFARQYYGLLGGSVYKDPVEISKDNTALVIIDAQYCITKDYYLKSFAAMGFDATPFLAALDQLETNTNQTLGNIEKILNKCREKGILPIHINIESYLQDGRDVGRLHKSAGLVYVPNSEPASFIGQAMPADDEIVLKKTCSSIHVGTPIDRVLRNMNIKKVIVAGFYTDQCVSTSVRDLSDLGYEVVIIEDAINAMSQERHENALQSIKKIYANSEKTDELLARLDLL